MLRIGRVRERPRDRGNRIRVRPDVDRDGRSRRVVHASGEAVADEGRAVEIRGQRERCEDSEDRKGAVSYLDLQVRVPVRDAEPVGGDGAENDDRIVRDGGGEEGAGADGRPDRVDENYGDGTVSAVDAASGKVRSMQIGGQPGGIAFGAGSIWVSDLAGGTLTR